MRFSGRLRGVTFLGTPPANLMMVPKPSLQELWAWLLGRRTRYRVSGASMEPTLAEGDHILVAHLKSHRRPLHVGDLVVSRHPFQDRIIVKRIRTILDGRVELVGDNPNHSHDSRGFGSLPIDGLLGRVTSRL